MAKTFDTDTPFYCINNNSHPNLLHNFIRILFKFKLLQLLAIWPWDIIETTDEIKWSIFLMKRDKALSPDGYSAHFVKHAWKTIERICSPLSTPFPQVNYSVRLIPYYIYGP